MHRQIQALEQIQAGLLCASLLLCGFAIAADSSPVLGRVLNGAEKSSLTVHVFADGSGLPEGGGSTETGKEIYAAQCAGCHGTEGQGGSALELVGDRALLATEYPDRGIGVYWPYGPTLFEYIRRAMPPTAPYSLSADEVYAVIAHLLELNELIESGIRIDAAALASIQMPNRDGFNSGYGDFD